jgi:Bacterial alpha-L-rhamnosidase 6 hairpin glycosidase domain
MRSLSRLSALIIAGMLMPAALLAPESAAAGAQTDNYAPASRTLAPVAVYGTSGTVIAPRNVLSGQSTRISGADSYLVLDFGKEVGGTVSLTFAGASGSGQQVGLAFSESSLYVGENSDLSNGAAYSEPGTDGALHTTVNGAGSYTTPMAQQRGGFRYLTVFLSSTGWVDLDNVSLQFTAVPDMPTPNAYPNSFHSNDPLLNKIWYAGAYTVQMDSISPNQGRVWPAPSSGWENDGNIGVGTSVLTDGAKRDRTAWPGDMGVSLPTEYVSTNDLASARNSLTTMYQHQNGGTGELEFGGPQFNTYGSDTYHTWTLVGTASYYTYSADKAWLDSIWNQYELGMSFITAKIDSSGLLNVTGTNDWARGDQGGRNIEANAILYHALTGGATLAGVEGDNADATTWTQLAANIKSAANAQLWNPAVGLYRDNPGSTLYPQDGNSLAVWYGLTDSQAKNTTISTTLAARWEHYGALTPEKNNGGAIGTFPGSMESQAHFVAGDNTGALALIRREWGYMLNAPIGTNSTFWEGMRYDGSFDYGGPYMSAAHGWATGPTSALTFYVLGLMPTAANGHYDFVPHAGDLTDVSGNITTPRGSVTGSWNYTASASTFTENLTSPSGTTGTVGIPTYGSSALTVKVNNATVWSGGTFTPTSGVTGGSTDGQYIYLTGVAPGSYTVVGTGVPAPRQFTTSVLPGQLPPGYTPCATEGGTCTPNGSRVMAFGAGNYDYQVVTGTTSCSPSTFNDDPNYGVLKSCYLAPAGGPVGYTQCANENGTCTINGTADVAFGLNGAYRFTVATGGIACDSDVFGSDPLPGTAKNCYVATAGTPPGNWTSCAAEKSSCAVTGSQPLAYGADGAYWTTMSNGTTTCSNDVVGVDPVFNVAKTCYSWTGPPTGYDTRCAAENDNCAFDGRRTVAFGADGDFVYKTFTGGVSCTNTAFGTDPIFDVAKSCYVVGPRSGPAAAEAQGQLHTITGV